jgi:putative acetyltransferase
MFEVRKDDLSGESVRALLAIHLQGMHASSPPGHVFALDLSGLINPHVTVWAVYNGEKAVAIGALKVLDSSSGEIKSMRTHPDYLRRGIAANLLEHLIVEARTRGWTRLSLETGSGPAFDAALNLYRRRGFVEGEAFGDYQKSSFNQFLHLPL